MSLVFWDTNLFIYLIEDHPVFRGPVEAIRHRMLHRGDRLCTSALTVGETLTGTMIRGDQHLAKRYRAALRMPFVEILPFDVAASEHYARIRTNPTIKRSDAIQLACAAEARVDLFLTNDRRLGDKHIPGIQFIAGLQNCPL